MLNQKMRRCYRSTDSTSEHYLNKLRHCFPAKCLLMFLLLVTLPQSVTSAPSDYSNSKTSTAERSLTPSSTSTSNKQLEISTEKNLLLEEEEMQATQSSACNSLEPPFLKTEDKIVLAPIVFQGKFFFNPTTFYFQLHHHS